MGVPDKNFDFCILNPLNYRREKKIYRQIFYFYYSIKYQFIVGITADFFFSLIFISDLMSCEILNLFLFLWKKNYEYVIIYYEWDYKIVKVVLLEKKKMLI